MLRYAITPLFVILLFGASGCGGGIQEGIPANAGQISAEQQKAIDDAVAEEEAAAKAQGKKRE